MACLETIVADTDTPGAVRSLVAGPHFTRRAPIAALASAVAKPSRARRAVGHVLGGTRADLPVAGRGRAGVAVVTVAVAAAGIVRDAPFAAARFGAAGAAAFGATTALATTVATVAVLVAAVTEPGAAGGGVLQSQAGEQSAEGAAAE